MITDLKIDSEPIYAKILGNLIKRPKIIHDAILHGK